MIFLWLTLTQNQLGKYRLGYTYRCNTIMTHINVKKLLIDRKRELKMVELMVL